MKKKQTSHNISPQSQAHTLGIILIIIGALYRFCYLVAPTSPLYIIIQSSIKIAFGVIGTHIAFALVTVMGILIVSGKMSSHRRLLKGISIMIFVSSILNFPLIDNFDNRQIQSLWGYISWPILSILKIMLGHNPFAIKILIVIVSIGMMLVLFKKQFSWSYNSFLWSWSIRAQHSRGKSWSNKSHKHTSHTDHWPGWRVRWRWWWFTKSQNTQSTDIHHHTIDHKNHQDYPTITNTTQTKSPSANTKQYTNQGKLIDISNLTSQVIDHIKNKVNHTHISQTPWSTHHVSTTWPSPAFSIQKKTTPRSINKPTFPLKLLSQIGNQSVEYNTRDAITKAQLIVDKLKEFNIAIDFVSHDIGPSIIQLRFQAQAGVKLSTIESYKGDIQSAIRVKTLIILAPIPGTDTIGMQIPNPHPRIVNLSEVLSSWSFDTESSKNQTNLTIGIDVENNQIIKSLESMPHLLVAWATWSGKSVGINDFILSLLYQNTPSELKFVMIDPKQVELEMYDGLPYLLAPVITTPDQALKALKRCVDEMETRYTKLKNVKLKHLSEYNQTYPQDAMSRIVIIIDELADLMLSGNKKEIETSIVRIAQKARAVGMHLITATQRPSVNVITGLIKANIPTRIAFGVAQLVDSRTILDQKGAENLVGKWDLLYLDSNIRHPLRIQAPYVSTQEISDVVQYLKSKLITKSMSESDFYDPQLFAILSSRQNTNLGHTSPNENDDEELIQQAIAIISAEKKASTTLLQRKLSIGFARAWRLMDTLEQRGIVWPQDWAKPRSILI
jgi:DNA segregation ATPase FtsK/SpoIIIE-like protein